MPFHHIVLSRLKESAAGESKAEIATTMKQRFEALVRVVPGLVRCEVRIDILHRDDSSDVILFCDFDSRASYEGYITHPAHEAIVEYLKGKRTERRLIDWET
jgi:hypothetical protein